MLLSSFFTRSMVFAHIPRAQLLFALLSETFLTIRQNSLNVTVCMIARSSCRGYFIHSLSTLYYYNAPSLATRLTGDYRDRTFTGKCGPASLDTQNKSRNAPLFSSAAHFSITNQSDMIFQTTHLWNGAAALPVACRLKNNRLPFRPSGWI